MTTDLTALDDNLYNDDAGKMTTFSGRRVNPLTMTADDVAIVDIAHSLSRQCRFNGHVAGFYTVARHSLWVSELLEYNGESDVTQLAGLLHDAAEAYLGDMIRPLKHGALGDGYRVVEGRLEAEIAKRYGLPWPWPDAVGAADNAVLMTRELGGVRPARWYWTSTPADDQEAFMARYCILRERIAFPIITITGGIA